MVRIHGIKGEKSMNSEEASRIIAENFSIRTYEKLVNHFKRTGKKDTTCNFDYSGRVAETILLGPVAYRCGKKLEYDAKTMTVTNCPEAAKLLKQDVRKGWEV